MPLNPTRGSFFFFFKEDVMGIYSVTIFHTVCERQSWGSSRYNAAPLEIKSCVFFGDTLKNIVPTEKLCLLGCYLNHRGQLWTTWNRYLQNTTSTLNKLHCLLSVFQNYSDNIPQTVRVCSLVTTVWSTGGCEARTGSGSERQTSSHHRWQA